VDLTQNIDGSVGHAIANVSAVLSSGTVAQLGVLGLQYGAHDGTGSSRERARVANAPSGARRRTGRAAGICIGGSEDPGGREDESESRAERTGPRHFRRAHPSDFSVPSGRAGVEMGIDTLTTDELSDGSRRVRSAGICPRPAKDALARELRDGEVPEHASFAPESNQSVGSCGPESQAVVPGCTPSQTVEPAPRQDEIRQVMKPVRSLDDSEDDGALITQRAAAASRSTWVSVWVNVGLTATQVTMGVVSGSQGLVADGLHSLSDLVADFVVLLAGHQSRKGADEAHPYGHHRFETGASLVLGALLLIVGVGMLWAAVRKLEAPAIVRTVSTVALWAVGVTLIAKELLFRYMLRVAKRLKSSMLVANAWHARSDAASSLVVAFGIAGNLAGYPILDPIAALIVGLMVSRMGWRFGWEALHDLMDRAVDQKEVEAIRQTLLQSPGIQGLHDLRTRKMGDMILVDVHLDIDGSLSVTAGHDIALGARQRVMERHRVLNVMTHVDPWRSDAERVVPAHSQSRSI
jgi:cation diffusion facilitator family transporter